MGLQASATAKEITDKIKIQPADIEKTFEHFLFTHLLQVCF